MATVPATRTPELPAQMSAMIQSLMPNMRGLLPPDIAYEQFRAALWLELTGRPALNNCSAQSLRSAMVKAATLGLLPGRDCHLLPYSGQAQCISNYHGLVLVLERTGKLAKAFAHPVYEGDEFVLDFFADNFSHIPYMVRGQEPGKILFYYGAVKLKGGITHVEPMSLAQIDGVRRRAPGHEKGPWLTDTIEMSRKTALRRVSKFVQLTPQVEELLNEEEETARLGTPAERANQASKDLFGDHAPDIINVTPAANDALWRETVAAHYTNMPAELQEECRVALENPETPERVGHQLVDRVLYVLEHPAESAD